MQWVGSRRSVGFLSVVATLFAVVPSALASNVGVGNDTVVGGTVQLGPPTLQWEKTVGKDLIRQEDGSLTFTGTIIGGGTLDVLAHVSPAGKETFVAHWTAPATVDGTSGTLDLTVHGRDDGTFSGTILARGSGGLAGLVGQGRFTGQDATGAGTYTFHYTEIPSH
jgi:hypothetical protein